MRLSSIELELGRVQWALLTRLMRRTVGARERVLEPRALRVPVFVRDARDGAPPVLLVHGFGGDKESWLVFAALLRRSRGLVVLDLPGFGAAAPIPGHRASARAQAEVLAGVLDALGIRRAHVVGNSMGGGIAQRFAADFPERAASMTLLGSVGPLVEKSEVGLAFDRGENPLLTTSEEDLARLLSLVAERMPPTPRPILRYLGADRLARREAQAALFEGWVGATGGEGVPTDLASIRTPALVVHGERDRVIHPATARALGAQLPDARVVILPGIGHVPQIEAPRRVAKLTESFWRSAER